MVNPKTKYKAISLFSGAGGMDIGVRNAGFDILAQIEMDQHCCNTLRAAKERENSNTEIVESDIGLTRRINRLYFLFDRS